MDFQAYRIPLVEVSASKYLEHVLISLDDNYLEVVCNFRKARKQW